MIVCHCNAVSDRRIRALVEAGAQDIDDITDACGAGGDCGGCRLRIERLLPAEQHVMLRVAS